MKKQIISLAACLIFAAIATATGTTGNKPKTSSDAISKNADSMETAEARVVEDTGIPAGEGDIIGSGNTNARKGMPANKKMSRTPAASETVQPSSTY